MLILLESYGPHVTVYHVPSHAGLPENEQVDTVASQGRLRSPLWTANKLLLVVLREGQREEPEQDLHILAVRESTPPPPPLDDFVPWVPESVLSRADSSVVIYTPQQTRPSDGMFINLDTPSPQHSRDAFVPIWSSHFPRYGRLSRNMVAFPIQPPTPTPTMKPSLAARTHW